MNVSIELIAAIARKLHAKYGDVSDSQRPDDDLLLGSSELSDAIEKLIEDGLLSLGDATEPGDLSKSLIEKIMKRIKRIQRESGILKADGILAARTLKWLLHRPFAHHPPGHSIGVGPTDVDPNSGFNSITYHVPDGALARLSGISIGDADRLLQTAWLSWFNVCDVVITRVGRPSEANVIVDVKRLTGEPTSVVAVADIGPPGKRQLELSFDMAETWSLHKFEATACHEIGHILGIRHIPTSNQLMNDTLHDHIKIPQDRDAKAAQDIWGTR